MAYQRLSPEAFAEVVLGASVPVVLAVGSSNCPGCRVLEGALDALEDHYGPHIRVVRLLATHPDTLEIRHRYLWERGISFSVNLIPVTIVMVGGEAKAILYGPRPAAELARMVHRYLPGHLPVLSPGPVNVQVLGDRCVGGYICSLPLTPREVEVLEREGEFISMVAQWKAFRL